MGFICDFIIIWISAGISGISGKITSNVGFTPCHAPLGAKLIYVGFPHKVGCEMLRDGASSDFFY